MGPRPPPPDRLTGEGAATPREADRSLPDTHAGQLPLRIGEAEALHLVPCPRGEEHPEPGPRGDPHQLPLVEGVEHASAAARVANVAAQVESIHGAPARGRSTEELVEDCRLRGDGQLPLPFPPLHRPTEEGPPCARGVRIVGYCPHHPPSDWAELIRTETCSLQRCDSSAEANTLERARDAYDGTADNEAERLGFRHFGQVAWAVFVFTLPAELRPLCTGRPLKAFHRQADEMAVEILRAQARDQGSEWFVQSWIHPVGEPRLPPAHAEHVAEELDPDATWHPHANVIIPLACLRANGRSKRVLSMLPAEWLGSRGWISARWRERLSDVFGTWWQLGPFEHVAPPLPAVNWFFEWRRSVEEKKHALRYFARVFPRWAHHALVPLRPRSSGLKHWKHVGQLRRLLDRLREVPLPRWSACPGVDEGGGRCEAQQLSGAGPDVVAALHLLDRAREAHAHSCEAVTCPTRGAGRLAPLCSPSANHQQPPALATGPPRETVPP